MATELLTVGSYGGVLIFVGHCGNQWVTLESYTHDTAGYNEATQRIDDLVHYWGFSYNELGLGEVTPSDDPVFPAYAVALTNDGIDRFFQGSSGLAYVAGCTSYSTRGKWGARVECLYGIQPNDAEATEDITALFNWLGGKAFADFSKMTVSLAKPDRITLEGNGNTALIPWITGYSPDNSIPLVSPPTDIRIAFGTTMQATSNPIYVGGYAVVRGGNGWEPGNTTAKVTIYYGWELGTIFVWVDGNHLMSSNGIKLFGGNANLELAFTSAVNSYPPAASVSAFRPAIGVSGVVIDIDMMSMRGTPCVENLGVSRAPRPIHKQGDPISAVPVTRS